MAIGTPPKKMFQLENHRTTWGLIQLAMFDSWRAFRWMFNPCLCSNSTDHLHHTGRCLATGDSNSLQKYKWQPVFPLKMILVNGGFHIFYHLAILFNHFTRGCKVFRREYYTNKWKLDITCQSVITFLCSHGPWCSSGSIPWSKSYHFGHDASRPGVVDQPSQVFSDLLKRPKQIQQKFPIDSPNGGCPKFFRNTWPEQPAAASQSVPSGEHVAGGAWLLRKSFRWE